jgi:hypothetical protein
MALFTHNNCKNSLVGTIRNKQNQILKKFFVVVVFGSIGV